MGFKKHDWMNYGSGEEVIEITIKGRHGGRIDFFRCNNKKDYQRIVRIIRDKYGFDFRRNYKNQNNNKPKEEPNTSTL